jgi:hypothetical protein
MQISHIIHIKNLEQSLMIASVNGTRYNITDHSCLPTALIHIRSCPFPFPLHTYRLSLVIEGVCTTSHGCCVCKVALHCLMPYRKYNLRYNLQVVKNNLVLSGQMPDKVRKTTSFNQNLQIFTLVSRTQILNFGG